MTGQYRGRFAPTPSGPLHFGSLVAALGSYLDAKLAGGAWLVRIEDLDPPRVLAGAADAILRTLEAFGFEWDGPVMWQSCRESAYRLAFERLREQSEVYACSCSRAGCVGTCRVGNLRESTLATSWRVKSGDAIVEWEDRRRGRQMNNVPEFVVQRADGVFTYQLAVVVDDAEQGITDVVRGSDLLDSTARQIWLQQLLGYSTPQYLHLPLVRDQRGEKLSKQTYAPAISTVGDVGELAAAFRFLGYLPPQEAGNIAELWAWSISLQAAAYCSTTKGVLEGIPR